MWSWRNVRPSNAQLPTPNMLMMDRIVEISDNGGKHAKATSWQNWIFPNCGSSAAISRRPGHARLSGLDAMWQIIGFYLAWLSNPGHGRALAWVKSSFSSVTESQESTYKVELSRVITRNW